MECKNAEAERFIRMMEYVKRDPNTDEIIGIAENAPADMVQMYCAYMAETERREPVER